MILKYNKGITEIDFLCGNEIQSMMCQEALQNANNMERISTLVFREPENELYNERSRIGASPEDDIELSYGN